MLNPFDWQESVQNRAEFVLSRIETGAPVIGVSLKDGILLLTYRRQTAKIFEVYDRIAIAGIGQQSDIEALRVMAVEFAHREGFTRSEKDVTIQRVVTSLSGPIKRAFADLNSAPVLARTLLAEVGATPADDHFFTIEFDGDYVQRKDSGYISGRKFTGPRPHEVVPSKTSVEVAVQKLGELWMAMAASGGEAPVKTDGLTREAVLMERGSGRENVFRKIE